ncbi:protein phosphatase 1 regulatory subunit 37 isoform X2 [Rhinatrema bivittatum]|uniref:protein phosphatase 1 regulatory subunit 37 isoform X2 n=1 Tax=Rhinatrema bivittatum TaxID=194408 RepID=UPI00112681A8|nr:protein phosphatase 1 regulatory subunit 37 isoform X2 [Rhinatrema bivittatum]
MSTEGGMDQEDTLTENTMAISEDCLTRDAALTNEADLSDTNLTLRRLADTIGEPTVELSGSEHLPISSQDLKESISSLDSQTLSMESSGVDSTPLSPCVEDENRKNKHGSKRVTFPSDDDIVSGAVEPKDPWRHAQNVTVEEIITAYRQACQKLNCKQIPKLLKQLQEFKDLTRRLDCLDLKGEKLDYKACEALEEIFKRVQFKIVDVEQTNLDEDGASALFDMIEYYESATHLNISFNKHIGTRGWQAAAHMMRKTNCLQYLDARNTPLLDHSAPFVARALRISSSLTVLHLENASLSGRPLMLLATALKMNMNLRELYLADNKLNGLQDSSQLGNLLKFNCYIQILDLRNNHILDSGLAYVCEGLKEQRKGLVTLVLWNNQLTHTGMVYLGMMLPHTQSLETLNLGHNPIGNEGVRNLKNGLIGNRTVLRLGLAASKLSCEGAVAVAEFIAESPRLLRLDLRENEIKTGGLMALSLALKVNHSLLRLDLDREPKKESVKSFIETQKALLAEIQNGCKRNFILAKEKEEKDQEMQVSASMPEITITEPLEENQITDMDEPPEQATEVIEALVSVDSKDIAEATSQNQKAAGSELDSDSDTDEETEVATEAKEISQGQKQNVQDLDDTHQLPLLSVIAVAKDQMDNKIQGLEEQMMDSKERSKESLPGSPKSPPDEKRIAVSSPGRGHKIFVVTRVEIPPQKMDNDNSRQEMICSLYEHPVVPTLTVPHMLSPKSTSHDTKTNTTVSKHNLDHTQSISCSAVSEPIQEKTQISNSSGEIDPNPEKNRLPDRSDQSPPCLENSRSLVSNDQSSLYLGNTRSLDSGDELHPEKIHIGACETTVHDASLPNGLKAEFLHVLPDASLGCDGKIDCTSGQVCLGPPALH